MTAIDNRTNPFQTLWQRKPRLMWLIVFILAAVAVLTSPLFFHVTGVFPLENPRPKSALWLISGLSAILAMGLVFARHRSWGAGLVVFVICLSLLLLSIDIVLRIWPPYEVAGTRLTWIQPHFTKNSWGFTDQEPRFDARYRILLLGDSIAHGFGDFVDQNTRFGELAEQRLRDEGLDIDLQTVAIGNTQFDEYLKNYRELAPKYDPNLVIVSWCLNDIEYAKFSREKRLTPRSSAKGNLRLILRGFAKRTKINEWILWTVLGNRFSLLARKLGWIEEDWLDKHNRAYLDRIVRSYANPAAVDQVREDFRWLATDCEEHDRKLLVVVFPYEFHLISQRSDEVETIKRALYDVSVRHVDLYPAYLNARKQETIYSFKDPCHPNARGHEIASDVLVEELLPLVRGELLPDAGDLYVNNETR